MINWVPTADQIELFDVARVKFRGIDIKKMLNATEFMWPGKWEDTWSNYF